MSLIIGVDGGGTKSTYLVFDTTSRKLKEYCGGSINFYSIGEEKAAASFSSVINGIKNDFKTDISSIFVGNAALGIGENIGSEHSFAKEVGKAAGEFSIESDLYIGLKGVNSTPSMFLISGTGSMGIAENAGGELFTVGGWGYLLGDQGSGYYIGIKGIREAIKAYEGICEPTLLTDLAAKYFNVQKLGDIIEIVYSDEFENKDIANFAVEVHRAAALGDKVSNFILNNSIDYLVKCIGILNERIAGTKTKLGVYGGNFQKSESFIERFKNKLAKLYPNIEVGFPEYSPVQAALLLAGKLINLDIADAIDRK